MVRNLNASFYQQPGPGFFWLSGADRLAYLQRQTSNDVRNLAPNRLMVTVLTSPMGRILDVLVIWPESEEIGVIPLPGRAASTREYFKRRIFFMDKVALADNSQENAQVDVIGPGSSSLFALMGLHWPSESEVVRGVLPQAGPYQALGLPSWFNLGMRLIVPRSTIDLWVMLFSQAGAKQLSPAEYEILRVQAGLPGVDHELTDEYTPLEIGLAEAVSSQKGCYTGQEVLARQVNFDKVSQHLCGLRVSESIPAGSRVWVENRLGGSVTSVVVSPEMGVLALAVLKRLHDQPGTLVKIGESDAEGVPGKVIRLPFEQS